MRHRALMMSWLALAGLAGCVTPDRVLFVTDTGIGMGYDTKPPSLAIDYHRFEGYVAPTYDNGALPPVVARIQSNLNIFHPKIDQTYATGQAAVLLTQDNPVPPADVPLLAASNKVAYFATDSSLGLKISYDDPTILPAPTAVNLGYKRKEFSWIPVGHAPLLQKCDETPLSPAESQARQAVIAKAKAAHKLPPSFVDCYGDTLASIQIDGTVGAPTSTGMQLDQFFATGTAARQLAANSDVRTLFRNKLRGGVGGTTGLVATLGTTVLKASTSSVPLTVNVAAINDEPVTISVIGATPVDVKIGQTTQPPQTTTAILRRSDLADGKSLAVTFDLKNLTSGTVLGVSWTGSGVGASGVIGGPITVQ